MNEQNILKTLMQNPAFKEALREMLIHDQDMAAELGVGVAAKNVYVWCAEMTDANTGRVFYHPIIAPEKPMLMPDINYMMNVENYSMMASEDQFEAYKYESMIKMFRSVYGNIPTKLIAVPEATYERLAEALLILVVNILDEINRCFDHLDRISAMANMPADMMKMNLIASVFGNMTTVAACFDREMEVHDSKSHDYTIHEEEDEDDDFDDDDEEEDYWGC